MSVLRNNHPASVKHSVWQEGLDGSVTVKCPKCASGIPVTQPDRNSPIRCPNCNYPLILRQDMMLIINACLNSSPNQTGAVMQILRHLSESVPEAGTALGMLANRRSLSLTEKERWEKLISAYLHGDDGACEWLDMICQANPGAYEKRCCKNCGAPLYIEKRHRGKTPCIFCENED